MCGIVRYTGPHQALPFVLEGLRRLEYRGYDSAGVAVLDGEGHLHTAKKAGALGNLEAFIDTGEVALNGLTGMGHTRWATHGGPTDRNAHPHTDVSGRVAVIHNGIIENFPVLRKQLEADGIEMRSDTDTEVVADLLGAAFDNGPTAGDLPASMAAVCRGLDGAFTLVAVHADAPGVLVAARRNSPLVVGVGDGEMFVASDVAAFIAHTRDAIELGQDQLVVITPDGYEITSFTGGEAVYTEFTVDWDLSAAEKGGFDFFMDKEIAEQPAAVADTLLGHFDGTHIVLDEQRLSDEDLRSIDKVFVVACGTAFHSGLIAKYAIEHWCRIPVEVEVASEFRYRDPVRKLAQEIAQSKAVLFLGRHVGYPVALEGALKLKELAYMHAEGFAAGELKHGPIALIEEGLPVVVITPSPVGQPLLHSKLVSNIREIQARGARTIVIAEEGDDVVAPFADTLIELPAVPALMLPLVATVPLQILAAEIARCRGYDIDKPRNLAKSVTVE